MLLRAPILAFRAGLGGLFGERLLCLTHIGRVSGRPRQVVLEVVDRGDEPDSFVVASAYARRSQWMRNVLARPAVRYQVGRRTYHGTAVPLPSADSGRRLADYARRHPLTAEELMRSLGHAPRDSADYEALGADSEHGVPLVLLRPDDEARGGAED
ncbi:hypothetical protein AN216_04740 [Streptomyces oceani]|uniref:Nitroreductase n=2 Tax=Streptomyces oceani TaxID=1075402 RepID=A0A1E7KLV4_9ACTN|nr:hypothetical protein AN216_04740 [Streptomyces oceani]